MLIKSLTSALLALSLGAESVTAHGNSAHGRFGQLARGPQEKAKKVIEATKKKVTRSTDNFEFLSKKTRRK